MIGFPEESRRAVCGCGCSPFGLGRLPRSNRDESPCGSRRSLQMTRQSHLTSISSAEGQRLEEDVSSAHQRWDRINRGQVVLIYTFTV
jgi:hypothetical protein